MQALLIKNDEWGYVSGEITKPALIGDDSTSVKAISERIKNDNKAKSDIILSICASELKQIKNCETSRDVWLKLKDVYQSKGPARKATLLKQLTLQRMEEGGDIREHLNKFFDAVDKLCEMEVTVNPDLLTIMLLYSLPNTFDNFRCAIESRDVLPTPEALRIKIIEESDARNSDSRNSSQNAMYVEKQQKKWSSITKNDGNKFKKLNKPEIRCYRCKRVGHKANECRSKFQNKQTAKNVENAKDVDLFISEALHTHQDNTRWCLDSGATSHLCKEISKFTRLCEDGPGKLNLANDTSTDVTAKGIVSITTGKPKEMTNVTLNNTLHVPDLRTNLLSVAKITDNNLQVLFKKDCALIMGTNKEIEIKANRVGDLYFVDEVQNPTCNSVNDNSYKELEKWHRRMGHINVKDLLVASKKGIIRGINLKNTNYNFRCDICFRGKMTRTPLPKRSDKDVDLLEIIHSDVFGPVRVESHRKSKYMVTFTDDKSRWTEVRFLNSKKDILKIFREFVSMVENQKNKKIKCLQTDNGCEYVNSEFDGFLKGRGIRRRLSVPYTPNFNSKNNEDFKRKK